MSCLVRRYLERTHALDQLLEGWASDHKEAMSVRDLEEAIAECLDLVVLARRAWNAFLDLIFHDTDAGEITCDLEDMVQKAIRRLAEIFDAVQRFIIEVEQKGYSVEKGAEFRRVAHDVRMLGQEVSLRLPPLNLELARLAIDDFKRGDFRLAGDLLHDLQSGCAQGAFRV
jgi:hypothetical protein